MLRRHGIRIALIGALALPTTSCLPGSFDATCRGKDGKVDVSWTPKEGAAGYRVYRGTTQQGLAFLAEVPGTAYADSAVSNGTQYVYDIRSLDAGGAEGSAAQCNALPAAGGGRRDEGGPSAVANLVCRAKDGKIDLTWGAVASATSYRVFRSQGGQPEEELGDVPGLAFADAGLVNGTAYRYVVVARNAQGLASADSNPAECTPAPRAGGTPPPAVASVTCRGKNDKVDVTWAPVEGAALYRVFRAQGTDTPVVAGEVTGNVLVDFGLTLETAYRYTVASVSASGAAAAPSPACDVTPKGRSTGNRPPTFTSQPLTSALEFHYWYTQLAATDPDGDAVTYSLVSGPLRMAGDAAGFVAWTPETDQIGPNAVEVRATDARGAFASQAFVVDVADFNDPPTITSAPGRAAKAGASYRYDVDAFDPEGKALVFSFGAPTPSGMSIDGASGLVSWIPAAGDAGEKEIVVRASDPDGGFGVQSYLLDVYDGSVDILSPKGEFEVSAGSTLEVPLQASQAAAVFSASPLPEGTTASPQKLLFAPPVSAVGEYAIAVQARVGDEVDVETITLRVTKDNRAPVLAAPGEQTVDEGQEIAIPVSATDPDGDPVVLTAPGSAPENSLFDAIQGKLFFRPSFEQAGVYEVEVAATDGSATTTATIPIVVNEKSPPSDAIDLVVDPLPSPTFQPSVRISGNVVGDPSGPPAPQPFVAITGLSPVSVRQGRTVEVTITGLNTQFAPNQSVANFGDGITVESLEVISPTQAKAKITADPAASVGLRTVRVAGSGFDAASVVAFSVETGATVFTGKLVDSFTQQPLANARVVVNGTGIEGVTDAAGNFRIEGVPAGAQQIVVAVGNYKVRTLDFAFDPNSDVVLPDPVALDALARPFQAGGSLPRASNLASVLDRNVGTKGGGLTQEQAEALVTDTLVALGGELVGVVDEAGNQLNPQLTDSGLMSLRAEGVRNQARMLVEGGTYTLRQISQTLLDAFDWGGGGPDVGLLSWALEQYAADAWENPGDPLNAMAIVLLNDGPTLSNEPPKINGDTTFNRFQTFLLVTSVILPSLPAIEDSLDTYLRSQGVDPAVIENAGLTRRPLPQVARNSDARRILEGAIAWLAPRAAYAAGEGVVLPPPNGYFNRENLFARSAFTRIMKYAAWNFAAGVSMGQAVTAIAVAGAQAMVAWTTGASGGVVGLVAANAFVTTVIGGILSNALEKLLFGLTLALNAAAAQPEPPLPERSYIDDDTQRLILEFERSVSEKGEQKTGLPGEVVVNIPLPGALNQDIRFLNGTAQYSYELYDFGNPDTTDFQKGVQVRSASLTTSQDPARANKLQFAIPLSELAAGVHFFRMATIQYTANVAYGLNAARNKFTYDEQLGAEDVSLDETNLLQGSYTLAPEQTQAEWIKAVDGYAAKAQLLPQIDVERARIDKELATVIIEQTELQKSTDAATKALYQSPDGAELVKSERLAKLAALHGFNDKPGVNLFDPETPEGKTILAELRKTRPDDTIRFEVGQKLSKISTGARDLAEGNRHMGIHNASRSGPISRARAALKSAPPGTEIEVKYETVDPDGTPRPVSQVLTADDAGRAALEELEASEKSKFDAALHKAQVGKKLMDDGTRELADQEVDPVRQSRQTHETTISQNAARQQVLEQRRFALNQSYRTALSDAIEKRRQKLAIRYYEAKPKIKAAFKVLNVVGGVITARNMYNDYIKSTAVLFSDLSPAFMYVNTNRNLSQFSIEAEPDMSAFGSTLIGEKGFRSPGGGASNPKSGSLRREFFDDAEPAQKFETGFPPEFVTAADDGYIYAHNANSAERFSGRMFRFDPRAGFAREFVGTINYWSSSLQYGRPASPIAMAAGRLGPLLGDEVIFVADIDYLSENNDAQPGKPILKAFEISRLREGGAYFPLDRRNHFVAQPILEDSRLKFTGPTDMAFLAPEDAATGGPNRLYISDEDWLLAFLEDDEGVRTLRRLCQFPGTQLSGVAFDLTPNPGFYFADYVSGQVSYFRHEDLLRAESDPGACSEAIPLLGLKPSGIYDLEIDQGQRHLSSATRTGVGHDPLPVVVSVPNSTFRGTLRRFGKEFPAFPVEAQSGKRYLVFYVTEEEQREGQITVSIRGVGSKLVYEVHKQISLAPGGATVVPFP